MPLVLDRSNGFFLFKQANPVEKDLAITGTSRDLHVSASLCVMRNRPCTISGRVISIVQSFKSFYQTLEFYWVVIFHLEIILSSNEGEKKNLRSDIYLVFKIRCDSRVSSDWPKFFSFCFEIFLYTTEHVDVV